MIAVTHCWENERLSQWRDPSWGKASPLIRPELNPTRLAQSGNPSSWRRKIHRHHFRGVTKMVWDLGRTVTTQVTGQVTVEVTGEVTGEVAPHVPEDSLSSKDSTLATHRI